MKPSPDLTQKLFARAKELNPSIVTMTSTAPPATLPVTEAAQVAQDYINAIWFEPKGDNHHNAMACPHCRQGTVLVAVDRKLVEKFVNTNGTWSLDDERKIIEAFKYALDHYA